MSKHRGYKTVSSCLRHRDPANYGGAERAADAYNRDGQTLAVCVDDYLAEMKMLNRTECALASWRGQLTPFLQWTDERSLYDPQQITRSILESYQRHLYHYRKKNGKPLGIGTQRDRIGSVQRLFAWLCRKRRLEANPASELELPKPEKRLPEEALSRSEIETVLSMPDITDPLGIRDRAILELFYSTGIRRAEMARLTLSNLNAEKRILWVRQGKGRKDRVVPVGSRALRWVTKYLNSVRPLLMTTLDEHALFLSGYGHSFTPDALGSTVTRYIRQADIGRIKGGCHLFRHTCATHLLEGGADIRYIQQLLGHESLDTTAIYTAVNISQLQAIHSKCHPAEKNA
jgi:integrase/recombinase XerD